MKNKRKLSFVTLFPNCPNIGLIKDVGQIPYGLQSYGFYCKLASSEIDTEGDYIKDYPLPIDRIQKITSNETINGILYLFKNAKNIDVINVYHVRRQTYIWSKIYKWLNPKGCIYLKLDIDFVTEEKIKTDNKYLRLFQKLTQIADFISGESDVVVELVQKYSKKQITVIPNGYAGIGKVENLTAMKENTFLTVGRIGTQQKATEVLLSAFSIIAKNCDWNLKVVGPVEEEFKAKIEEFYQNYPELQERVEFVGNIRNRNTLYEEYRKAKIFILPSRWESFAIVLVEATACGCYIIATEKVPSARTITQNETYGKIVPVDDASALASAMITATKQEIRAEEICTYANEKFAWNSICKHIAKNIMTCASIGNKMIID